MEAAILRYATQTLNSTMVTAQDWKKRWAVIILVGGAAILSVMLSIVFPMLFLLYINHDARESEPVAAQTQYEMEAEFQKIVPLPLSTQVQHGAMHKTHEGIINTAYLTKLSYSEIRAYYDQELGKQGWRFARESEVKYDGQDYGGRERFYCKGNYTADLQYAGRQEKDFGWTYAFTLSWPLSEECK